MPEFPYKPNALEGALMILKACRGQGKRVRRPSSRASAYRRKTLKSLVVRKRITGRLSGLKYKNGCSRQGWALAFAGTTYAMIKIATVEKWARLASEAN